LARQWWQLLSGTKYVNDASEVGVSNPLSISHFAHTANAALGSKNTTAVNNLLVNRSSSYGFSNQPELVAGGKSQVLQSEA